MVKNLIRVNTNDLYEALVDAYPRRKKKHKPLPISLEYNVAISQLAVIEAIHGRFQNMIPASGIGFQAIQVDGPALARVIATYSAEDELELISEVDHLVICRGKSIFRMPRLDNSAGKIIERKPQKTDPRHKSMPEGIDVPLVHKVDQKETWVFSINMDVAHPDSKKKKP